jgi:bisphosphoglycerate-independent phosphoglycerate mutase (AlkP superfamily)
MYAPIFFPSPAPVSPAVLAAERILLVAEGMYTVEGRYYASDADAREARRTAAERIVRQAERLTRTSGRAA